MLCVNSTRAAWRARVFLSSHSRTQRALWAQVCGRTDFVHIARYDFSNKFTERDWQQASNVGVCKLPGG